MNTGLVLALSMAIGLLSILGVYSANKAVEDQKGASIEKSMGIILVAINFAAGITALALLTSYPRTSQIISIVMLGLLLILQLSNKQGVHRMWAWNFFGAIFALILAFFAAGISDKIGKFQARELIWLVLYLFVLIAGAIIIKRNDSRDRKKKVDWSIIVIVLLVFIAIALIVAIRTILSR